MGASASKHKTHGSKRDAHRIPDRPSPPGKPQLVPGTPHSEPDVVTIVWDPPEYDGGAKITGYLVEHRRTGSPHWVRASPQLVRVPELTLSGLEPGWRYQFRVSAKNSNGMSEPGELSELLTVTLQRTAASAPHFVKELTDIVALENEKAELTVELRGTPAPTVAWYKDGMEIFSGRRHRIITENGTSTLIIHQSALSDEGEIKCAATNRVGHAVTKATLRIEAPPTIRLPRQYEDGLLFEKDEVMRLKVTVAGKPEPSISWLHNGEPLPNGGRYEMTCTEKHSMLRIDEARRSDRGEYQVKAVNLLGEDVVSFLVTVTDRPQAPGKAKVAMTLGRSVTLSWTAPEDDGGCKIGNYIVEYYRLGWNMWLKAATCRQLTTTLGELIEGSEYKFRIKAENPYGVSDPGEESDILFIPDPHRGLLTPPARHGGIRGVDDVGIEEWLLDPHKRQRDSTPEGSPSQDHKKVKKKPENELTRGKTPDRVIHPEQITFEGTGYFPKSSKFTDKEPQDAPKVPKRRAKRKPNAEDDNDADEEKVIKNIKIEGKTDSKMLVKEKSEDIHGSSELMLVLLPNSRATTEERESTRKAIIDSLKYDSPGIAPPMSLSAPELGTIEPERPMQRAWVSSTELLHEKAMARFYQAVAEEEQEKALSRRYSFERRSTSRTRDQTPQFIQQQKLINEDDEMLDVKQTVLNNSNLKLKAASDQTANSSHNRLNIDQKFDLPEQEASPVMTYRNKTFHQQYSEEEEMYSEQEELDEPAIGESDIEDEYIEEEEEEEDEYEAEEEEDELEEEEEELDDMDILGGSEISFNERPPYSVEEETYHPRNMTPRSGTFTALSAVPADHHTKPKQISEDLKNVTNVVTAVVSHSIQIPVKATLKPPEIVRPTVRIEVTPPPEDEMRNNKPIVKHVIKPIIKTAPPVKDTLPAKNQSNENDIRKSPSPLRKSPSPNSHYSPPQFTPDGRYLPNPNPQLPKPILKIRDHSQERTVENENQTTAPLADVEAELNLVTQSEKTLELNKNNYDKSDENINVTDSTKLRKKHVRIEIPLDDKKSIEMDDNFDLSLTGNVARNRRRSRSNSLVEAAADPTKCVIHHYSDIVKEFGRVRKMPTTLYLNYEDLKAAAQKSGEVVDPLLEPTKRNKTSTIKPQNLIKDVVNKEDIKQDDKTQNEEEEDPLWSSNEEKKYEFLMESTEMQQLPNLILLSDVQPKMEEEKEDYTETSVESATTEYSYEEEQVTEIEETESSDNTEIKDLHQIATKKVRSLIDYMTDLTMFIIACYLYAFYDERLAIPMLVIMIYRQAKDATVAYVKRTIAKLPRLPWRKRQ